MRTIAILAVLAATFIGICFILQSGPHDEKLTAEPAVPSASSTMQEPEEERVVDDEIREMEKEALAVDEGQEEEAIPPRVKTFIAGRVTDKVTGKPLTSFDVLLMEYSERIIGENVENREGEFYFPLEKGGRFDLYVQSSKHIHYRSDKRSKLEIPDVGGLDDLHIELSPGLSLSGRVVEDATGRPVKDALVGDVYRCDLSWVLLYDRPEVGIYTFTDEDGCFTLQGLYKPRTPGISIATVHPDFAEAVEKVNLDKAGEIELRLKPGYRIFGMARDDRGEPIPNLHISFKGMEVPMARPTLTGPDGCYRTAPIAPGEVTVTAKQWDLEFEERPLFTEESRQVEIIDRDQEVNFGPHAGHVTWSGKLIDYDGTPMKKAWIKAIGKWASETSSVKDRSSQAWCDEEGCFQMAKLVPGNYEVKIWVPQPWEEESLSQAMVNSEANRWGEVVFQEPGAVERDLRMPGDGTIVAGLIVDEQTGAPVLQKHVNFMLMKKDGDQNQYARGRTNPATGKFCMRNQGNGTFDLFVQGPGLHTQTVPSLKLQPGDVRDDFIFRVPRTGELNLILEGFSKEEVETRHWGRIQMKLIPPEGPNYPPLHISRQESQYLLELGTWEASIGQKKLGWTSRSFEIRENYPVDLVVKRSDLVLQEANLTIHGRLRNSDGQPIAGADLRFNLAGNNAATSISHPQTDEQGLFKAKRLMPGRFNVSCMLPPGHRTVYLQNIVIPENPSTRFFLDLVLPSGSIRGKLFDEETGLPLSVDPLGFRVMLAGAGGFNWISSSNEDSGNAFVLTGVPAGEFRLSTTVPGYDSYISDSFSMTEGESLVMDDLYLTPCGIIVLDVVDTAGNPVIPYWAYCNGKRIGGHSGCQKLVPPRRNCHWLLPVGDVILKVETNDHKTQEVPLLLEAGKPLDVRMVLEPK